MRATFPVITNCFSMFSILHVDEHHASWMHHHHASCTVVQEDIFIFYFRFFIRIGKEKNGKNVKIVLLFCENVLKTVPQKPRIRQKLRTAGYGNSNNLMSTSQGNFSKLLTSSSIELQLNLKSKKLKREFFSNFPI